MAQAVRAGSMLRPAVAAGGRSFIQGLRAMGRAGSAVLGRASPSLRARPARSLSIQVQVPGAAGSTVEETTVRVVMVNYAGERTVVTGRVGQSLTEAAADNEYEYLDAACGGGGGKLAVAHNDEWTEDQYGEGAFCSHCHVVLPLEDAAKAPAPLQDELQRLEDHVDPERVTRSSRLGCQVTLTKAMDGMVVHVPDSGFTDIP